MSLERISCVTGLWVGSATAKPGGSEARGGGAPGGRLRLHLGVGAVAVPRVQGGRGDLLWGTPWGWRGGTVKGEGNGTNGDDDENCCRRTGLSCGEVTSQLCWMTVALLLSGTGFPGVPVGTHGIDSRGCGGLGRRGESPAADDFQRGTCVLIPKGTPGALQWDWGAPSGSGWPAS